MKILGICCSPRKEKTTYYALRTSLEAIPDAYGQVNTHLIDLSEKEINGCKACGACMKKVSLFPHSGKPQVAPQRGAWESPLDSFIVYSKSRSCCCFSNSSWSLMYLRMVSSSRPTVLTQ